MQNARRQQKQTCQSQKPFNQHPHYFYIAAPTEQRPQCTRNAGAAILHVQPETARPRLGDGPPNQRPCGQCPGVSKDRPRLGEFCHRSPQPSATGRFTACESCGSRVVRCPRS